MTIFVDKLAIGLIKRILFEIYNPFMVCMLDGFPSL